MSDDEQPPEEKPFCIEVAKNARAVCKKCKQKCLQGELRLAKLVSNPFGGDGKMKAWHHVSCLFEMFQKQRATTKRIETPEDIDGWDLIGDDEQQDILKKIKETNEFFHKKFGTKPPVITPKKPKVTPSNDKVVDTPKTTSLDKPHSDNLFKQFRRLVADITNNSSYLDKTECVKKLFTAGSDGTGFKGDIALWCKLLLPGVVKRVYNLQSKQLVKLHSRIFLTDQDDMLEDLEQGDIGETIQKFFEQSSKLKPAKKSLLTVKDVDNFLDKLTKLTKEDDQIEHFKSFIPKCTSNDLKAIIRLIKGDLRMQAGAKHILEGVHPDAYGAYQASRDIDAVIKKCLGGDKISKVGTKEVKADITLMTPVLPMLAEACGSVEMAMKKCPNGMYSEIKYDGERVQVHKSGSDFRYFSRSLKPVMPYKIQHFKDYIPKAFPDATSLVLDSEILLIDTKTGKPLPFGSLGVHKKTEFKDANVCLFVFDCMYFNNISLINKPLSYRKKILKENMTEIPNRILFSEMEEIHKPQDLTRMIAKVLKLGLEGLVLKDLQSIYEPGKRHWLKVKKDYLFGGAMADTADLIVLGAWYGTGKKGGMMSVFLMGCYNPKSGTFCTVTKVHTGHDDKTLEKLQTELDMEKISQDVSKVPKWLNCTKTMVPDFVAKDPKKQPVWEITGAEFTQHEVHTADGISIRFPRVTRIRDDKTWETATNLQELQNLYTTSKENTDVSMLMKNLGESSKEGEDDNDGDGEPKAKKVRKDTTSKKHSPGKPKTKAELKDMETADINQSRESDSEERVEIKNPLPDYFIGVKAIIDEKLKRENKEIIRYFIAYGAIELPEDRWNEATHVLHYDSVVQTPSIKSPATAQHVHFKWIKDTVAKGELQNSSRYFVKWDPES